VAELSDDDFNVREEASRRLRAAGRYTEAALQKAADSKDPEVRKRARAILADFRWGIYPDTPAAIVTLIRDYQAAARQGKRAFLRKLFDRGTPGVRALLKIAQAEADPQVRQEVVAYLSIDLFRALPELLLASSHETIEGLLEVSLAGDVKAGVGNYAAYALLSGQLRRRIGEFEALARKHPPGKAQQEVLAYLYRAKGDLTAARKAAAQAEREDLVEALLFEASNWKELARRPKLVSFNDPLEQRAFRASFHRLAGDRKQFAEIIQTIRKDADALVTAKGNVLPAAKVLFLNGHPAEAVALLARAGREPRVHFEVLVTQLKVKQAREVVEEARKAKSLALPMLEILEARTLHELGQTREAQAVLERYAAQVKPGTDAAWFGDLVEVAVATGQRARAHEVAARVLEVSRDQGWPARLFHQLYPQGGDEAAALWFFLRQQAPKDTVAMVYGRLRDLMEGKASARELETLIKAAEGGGLPLSIVRPLVVWVVLGNAASRCNQDKLAERCWRQSGSAAGVFRRADLLARQKRWEEAAKLYAEACLRAAKEGLDGAGSWIDAYPAPLGLYLSGHALTQAGQKGQGDERMRQAHLLPLGNSALRFYFAGALARRGFQDAAHREYDLLRVLGEPCLKEFDSFYTSEAVRDLATRALARKEWLAGTDAYERHFLRGLHPGIALSRAGAAVGVPATLHRWRARGLLQAGKVDDALREAAVTTAYLPGGVNLAIDLVPDLERKGRKKEAGQLFTDALALHEGLIRDYPRAAVMYNQAAWLCACCKRDLAKGLAHARKAVALDPARPAYHDTLAEVLFQLGKQKEAVEAQKKAIALDPKRTYYRKQLKRFQAGNPKAERPSEEE
jgi:tetratricopeptide (TPR) repeat protein